MMMGALLMVAEKQHWERAQARQHTKVYFFCFHDCRSMTGNVCCAGDFRFGFSNGTGKFTWSMPSGFDVVYEGEVKNSFRHGYGVLTDPAGPTRYEGFWKDDRKHGKGKFYYANGSIHEGEYVQGQPNGQGVMTAADGSIVFEGKWRNGQPCHDPAAPISGPSPATAATASDPSGTIGGSNASERPGTSSARRPKLRVAREGTANSVFGFGTPLTLDDLDEYVNRTGERSPTPDDALRYYK